MKRKLIFLCVLGVSLVSMHAFGGITRVQIPINQKNITLSPGELFKFNCFAWNDGGQQELAQFYWKITDFNDFQTTLPGYIDGSGVLKLDPRFTGAFKVVATEVTSGLSDAAYVQINNNYPVPGYRISRIEIFPSWVQLYRGNSVYLSIRCYDAYNNLIPRYTLRYTLRDAFGRLMPNYINIQPPGVLSASPFLAPGSYTISFEDVGGPAQTMIHMDLY